MLSRKPTLPLALVAGVFMSLLYAFPAAAAEEEVNDAAAVMLVARPQLQHPLYGSAVLVAKPIAGGMHLGFIVNKPTRFTLGEAFPDHESYRQVAGALYIGGPVEADVLFALVQRHDSPGRGSIRFSDDLFVAIAGDTVDRIIQAESDHARFLFGTVLWRDGELQEEVRNGLWYVMEPEAGLLLDKDTAGLWEELVRRSERQRSTL
jgi:putative transcriptional regulator